MGTISIMGRKGDVKVTWNPDVEAEVEAAKRAFAENVKKGFTAFRINERGKKGEQIQKFDAQAEEILFIPPMQGGGKG